MTNTAVLPWRTSSCSSITSERSRETCRWEGNLCFYWCISCLIMLQRQYFGWLEWMFLQDRFQEDPVHMAMIISRNLKEEQKILDTAKSTEVKPAAQHNASYLSHICRIWRKNEHCHTFLVKACLCSRRVWGCHQPWWWRNRNWTPKWKRWKTAFW